MDELDESLLVSNMAHESSEMDTFPVLIGDEVTHFHSVSGGYDTRRGLDIVEFIHRVQGPGSPYRVDADQLPHTIEAHLDEQYYYLSAAAFDCQDEYPDEDYVLTVFVESYQQGPYSFSEALSDNVDGRETRHQPNGVN